MIELHAEVQHSLGQERAIERVRQLVATLTEAFPQQVHRVQWHARNQSVFVQFVAYGFPVSWRADIYDDIVSLSGAIPDSARSVRRKIIEATVARVEQVLHPGVTLPRAA
ncbi:MAG: hypothetical protein D6753_10535 [Planctomycetota bacterium]|nr:MAG: hypothetical protein D6753_10535 [Planctomycetota bacterium]